MSIDLYCDCFFIFVKKNSLDVVLLLAARDFGHSFVFLAQDNGA